ncbi:hypothetical protein CEXT_42161, partial [Caerostris extrusa]
ALLCQEAVSLHAVEPIPPFRDWLAAVVTTLSLLNGRSDCGNEEEG